MDTKAKLGALRTLMKKHKIAGFLQPVHDTYMSEYPPASNRRVEWLTGFAGSAGAVAVLKDKAALFVDGRYTLQAEAETDGALFERFNSATITADQWMASQLKAHERVAYDPMLHGRDAVRKMQTLLAKKNIELIATENLVDAIWKNRPAEPASPVCLHEEKYSGESSAAKRRRIAELLRAAGADCGIISMPDSMNWLLNIRAQDVEGSPLALGVAIIGADARVKLFIKPERVSKDIKADLGKEVSLCAPDTLAKHLASLSKKRVLCDPQSLPMWYLQHLQDAKAVMVEGPDPCLLPKAMKNKTELSGIRSAHARDGVAVVKLLCWLDHETAKRKVDEIEVCEKLLAFRAQSPLFRGVSFNTISGSGPNGAIVHYRVSKDSNRILKAGELFLLDSGGQYPDGTTDITRTVAIGKPQKEHKVNFTRVLKGHIALARARFPEGTSGSQLDALARQFLWEAGLDYDHGTGHGVGCFLNVHEGPQRISKRGGDAALRPGMIVSNEPGYYKSGAYGIRIENLVTVVEKAKGENRPYLGFESLSCVPIDTRLVETSLLGEEEKSWLNDYHAWVEKTLNTQLNADEKHWLKERCKPL